MSSCYSVFIIHDQADGVCKKDTLLYEVLESTPVNLPAASLETMRTNYRESKYISPFELLP